MDKHQQALRHCYDVLRRTATRLETSTPGSAWNKKLLKLHARYSKYINKLNK